MPVDSPEPEPEPDEIPRKSGGTCNLMATFGVRRRGPVSPDDRVHDWREVT
jgi:hypothetical protein